MWDVRKRDSIHFDVDNKRYCEMRVCEWYYNDGEAMRS